MSAAHAELWTGDLSVAANATYNDNLLLLSNDTEGVFGATVSPGLDIRGDFGTVTLDFDVDATATRYNGDGRASTSGEDIQTSGYHTGAGLTRTGQRATFDIGVDFREVSTIDSELEDTGLVTLDNRRRTVSANSGVSYMLTRRDTVKFSVFGEDTSFDTATLTGYRKVGGSLGYSRNVNRTNEVGLTIGHRRVEPDSPTEATTDISSIGVTWAHTRSETVSLDMGAGASRVEFDQPAPAPDEDKTTGFASIEASWSMTPRDSMSLAYERSLEASGLGEVQQRDKVRASYWHGFTPRLSLTVPVTGIRQDSAAEGVSNERRYLEAGPSLSWSFRPNWALASTYRYRWQKFDSQPDAATSNAAIISLTYRNRIF